MKSFVPNPAHKEFNEAIKRVLADFQDRLDAMEMLAVASHLVGVLIAFQDQKVVSAQAAMDLVMCNIEMGNAEALGALLPTSGEA